MLGDGKPKIGAHGKPVLFLHPKDFLGTLVELEQADGNELDFVRSPIFFIIWWMVLFAMLPFGLRTQDEDGDVTLGTVSSAPRGPHMLRAVMLHDARFAAIVAVLFYV